MFGLGHFDPPLLCKHHAHWAVPVQSQHVPGVREVRNSRLKSEKIRYILDLTGLKSVYCPSIIKMAADFAKPANAELVQLQIDPHELGGVFRQSVKAEN